MFNNTKIALLPDKEIILKQDLDNSLLCKKQFVDVVTNRKRVYVLLGKDNHSN